MRILIATAFLVLTGCAANMWNDGGDELASFIGKRTAQPAERCVSASILSDSAIVNERTIVFRRTGTIYVNHLPDACPGMRPLATLVIEARGGQMCEGDLVSARQSGEIIPGPKCQLGPFTPYKK